jgi:antitoxin component YwqK of YwqJK toxin-antitoxin module
MVYSETLTGTSGDDIIYGYGGDDQLEGGDGVYETGFDTRYMGSYVSHHENGLIEDIGNYQDGELNGLQEVYPEDETLRERGNYKDGERDGLREEYFADGTLRRRENYKDGDLL